MITRDDSPARQDEIEVDGRQKAMSGAHALYESIKGRAARNNPRKWFHGVGIDATQIWGIGDRVTLRRDSVCVCSD